MHDPANTVVIELEHESWRRLVIEVANPSGVVAQIRAALEGRD